MQIIVPAALLVDQIVGKQPYKESQTYRLMTYVIQCPVSDGVLLYHTLTCCMVLLTKEEASHLSAQQELIDNWFLVPEAHNDYKLCQQIRQTAHLFQSKPKTISAFTILPTTGCNARCFYCYERDTQPVTMTTETANKICNYIMSHRGDKKILLRWFGGEPLVNVKVIDQICTFVKEHDVPYSSTMISNSYLFDAEIVHRAKDLWKLRDVQITLDGTAQNYNRIKRYIYGDVNAFERVLGNMKLLMDEGIFVSVRLNVDKHNIGEMSALVSLLHQRFGKNRRLSIYSHELFGERTPEDNAALYEQRMALDQKIAECGYRQGKKLQKDIKLNQCMADNDQSVLISPAGHLGKCDYYVDREFYGHIDSDEKDENIIRKFKEHPSEVEACATCPYYPQCVRLRMCHSCVTCTPEMQKENIHNTIEAMKDEYVRWKKEDVISNKQ